MTLNVFIPSRGRPEKQITADALLAADIDFTIVQSHGDESDYSKYKTIKVNAHNIGEKRQEILEIGGKKILMLDDDLKFRSRTEDNKFMAASPVDILRMINTIDEQLEQFAHVGILDEFMSVHAPRGYSYGGRYNQVLGYNQELFPAPPPSFRLRINEEHDMNLQLQSAGLISCVLCEFTKGSKFYANGGLSHYRTPEVELMEHQKFADLWPQLVTIKDAPRPLSGKRVSVKWKKACK